MQDEPISASVDLVCDRVERLVLVLLLSGSRSGPWSTVEVAREVGCDLVARDALVGLHAAGLVHRCGEFVWPSRPAARFHELTTGPPGRTAG